MRKLLWMIILFGVYVWVMHSGRDHFISEQVRGAWSAFVAWFDDAELDFQAKSVQKSKKKSRRWD